MTRFLLLLPLLACAPDMADNSLETPTVQASAEGAVTGAYKATAKATAGDWLLTVGAAAVDLHSPSRADLSAISGDVTLTVGESWSAPAPLSIADGGGLAYVVSSDASEDGTSFFGRAVWAMGETLGAGEVLNEYDEAHGVDFKDVRVLADDGEWVLLPGEPAAITLDGQPWRVTVIAAYEAHEIAGAKCQPADILSIELIRTSADPGEPLSRPSTARAPSGMCG